MEMLTGYGPPLLGTEGKVGQHYKDLNNGDIYKCVKVSVVTTIHFPTDADYIWELTIKGDQQADLAETDETKPGYVKNRELITQLSEKMVKSVTQAITPIQEDVGNLESTKVSLPVTNSTPNYGTAGQFAVSDGNGGITWKTLVEAEGVDY